MVSIYPCKRGGSGKGNAKRNILDNVGKAFCSGEILGYIFWYLSVVWNKTVVSQNGQAVLFPFSLSTETMRRETFRILCNLFRFELKYKVKNHFLRNRLRCLLKIPEFPFQSKNPVL